MSFKIKIFLVLLMVSILPYTIAMVIFSDSYKKEQRENITTEMQTQLFITLDRIKAHLDTLKSDMKFLAHTDVMNDLVSNDIDHRISKMLLDKKKDLLLEGDLYTTNTHGIIIASSDFSQVGKKLSQPVLFSIPIISLWNTKIGTIHASYELSNVKRFFLNIDYRHYFLKSPEAKELFKPKSFNQSLVAMQILPYFKGYQVVIEEDLEKAFEAIRKYETWFFLTLILGTVAISIISYFFASRLIKPIEALSNTALNITKTQDYAQQVSIERKDEIGKLASSFNEMTLGMNQALQHNKLLTQEIEDTQREVIFTMGNIGEHRCLETGLHVKRVAEYSYTLALHYGLTQEMADMLKVVSPMHDIGKVAIPDAILLKPAKLTEAEYDQMKKHAELGYKMLNHSPRELLKLAAVTAYEHHEKWNGTGYPRALKGDDIHIFGRITALADVFDALGSRRVYKDPWSDEDIFTFIKNESGKAFEPKLVSIFFEQLDAILLIRDNNKD